MSFFRRSARTQAAFALILGIACSMIFAPSANATKVVVDLQDGVDPAAVAKKYGIVTTNIYTEVSLGFSADVNAKQLRLLQRDKAVAIITNDGVAARIDLGIVQMALQAKVGSNPQSETTPQPDQYISSEIQRVRATSSVTADIDGEDDQRVNADIAILDTGVDPHHPDLNVAGGYDCVPGRNRGWHDRDGHGTMVAGQAAAIDNEIGVVGTAPGARIWSVRIFDENDVATDSSFLCGLEWVIRNAKTIEVANLSISGNENLIGSCWNLKTLIRNFLGKRTRFDRIHQRICRAHAQGVTLVAAAGNDGADASDYIPAVYPEVIAVSAMVDFDGKPGGLSPTPEVCYPDDVDDTFAVFSNHGAPIDIAAPGVCNVSTFPGGLYAVGDGTSFAAPLVAGAAALVRSKTTMSPAQVRAQLLARAEPGPIPGDPDTFAEGILDASTL